MGEPQVEKNTGLPEPSASIIIPTSTLSPSGANSSTRLRSRLALETFSSPVNQNGSFEFDRVLKSGYAQKRTQKTKGWKPVYLVLRPTALSIYKTDKEDKLRHNIYLSDLTTVSLLKDPKHKRKNVFGLFSPARNWHFQSGSATDAQEWVDLIRNYARIEEEEEEMLLSSPIAQRLSCMGSVAVAATSTDGDRTRTNPERFPSSSPEPFGRPAPHFTAGDHRQAAHMPESSGYSGNELASHSDFSDTDIQRVHGMSIEDLAVQSPAEADTNANLHRLKRPGLTFRNTSQLSGLNMEHDPDRVVWQGWLWLLRSKGGVRQWKNLWAVLRPRNLILYKDESEYTAQFILHLSAIVNVVDIDPVSKTKTNCLQVITEEKSYRFCAHDEESLVQCLGAFKSLLAKRRELEVRSSAAANQTKVQTG